MCKIHSASYIKNNKSRQCTPGRGGWTAKQIKEYLEDCQCNYQPSLKNKRDLCKKLDECFDDDESESDKSISDLRKNMSQVRSNSSRDTTLDTTQDVSLMSLDSSMESDKDEPIPRFNFPLQNKKELSCDIHPRFVDAPDDMYEVDQQIGQGAYGAVHQVCKSPKSGEKQCNIVMKKQELLDKSTGGMKSEVAREFRITKELQDRDFKQMPKYLFSYDCNDPEKVHVMGFEKYDYTVSKMIKPNFFNKQQIDYFMKSTIKILKDLHQYDVFHMDTHLENFMVKIKPRKVVLIDFGLSLFKKEIRDSSVLPFYRLMDYTNTYLSFIITLYNTAMRLYYESSYQDNNIKKVLNSYLALAQSLFKRYVFTESDIADLIADKDKNSLYAYVYRALQFRIDRFRKVFTEWRKYTPRVIPINLETYLPGQRLVK